tara:strand:+ start:11889 stop:12743 length:855 start_codon:yes stop_codon:yes gene_type:complete
MFELKLLKIVKLSVMFMIMLSFGCSKVSQQQSMSPSIIFPFKWVGDIDKIKFSEPSGICWHSQRKTLFVVGDQGDVCEIKPDGTLISQKRIRSADFEGITHDPSTGLLYIALEGKESVIELNPETLEVLREFSLPRKFEDKVVMKSGGQGIEALTFVPDMAHPEGGTFCVANQSFSTNDKEDISAVFVVELPLRSKTGEPKLLNYFNPGIIDVSGLHYSPIDGHIFVISDVCNVILEYSPTHKLLKEFAFPGNDQEGIAVDDKGFMYIAQDSGGIIKLKSLRNE